MEAEVRSILTAAAHSADSERGFGSFLAATFAGTDAPTIPPRSELPQPVDFS